MSSTTSTYRLEQEVTNSLVTSNALLTNLAIFGGYATLYNLTDKDYKTRTLLYLYVFVLELYDNWDDTDFVLEEDAISRFLSKMKQLYKSCSCIGDDVESESDSIDSSNVFGGDGTTIIQVISSGGSGSISGFGIAVTTISGEFGILDIGATTYQNTLLIGASLQVIFVNNIPEFKISGQFTFNPITGTINRNPNTWASGDTLVII